MAKLSMLEAKLFAQDGLPDAATIESGLRDALRSFYHEPTSPDPGDRMPAPRAAPRLEARPGGSRPAPG
ncbi:MAG: hypothetical protein R3E12_12285 [Candidatus Eisenbacteria bacterium]